MRTDRDSREHARKRSYKTVDDRALNQHVVGALRSELSLVSGSLHVLEVGAGLGTMVARLVD